MTKHPLEIIEDILDLFFRLNLTDDAMDYSIDYGKYSNITKVVLIGSNPEHESPDNSAFHPDTKSGKTVRSWFNNEPIYVLFKNLHEIKGGIKSLPKISGDTQISIKRDLMTLHGEYDYKIIACGNYVSEELDHMKIPHFMIPHPSELNRFWNNKEAGAAKIKDMLEWIKNGN